MNLTRALVAEWGKYNTRVNAIAPGYFPSKMTTETLEKHSEKLIAGIPLGKLGRPADLKGIALLFASPASGHISGQIMVVDGGAIVT